MALNSPSFLFLFLPVFIAAYTFFGKRLRNLVLLIFSLAFYFWSEPLFSPLVLTLVLANFLIARAIFSSPPDSRKQSHWLTFGVILNLLPLIAFKLLAAYGQLLAGWVTRAGLPVPGWALSALPLVSRLPLGFSFLTFQAISLLVDASRMPPSEDISPLPVATYLLMFPKIIAGPIMRFRDTVAQILERQNSTAQVAAGLRRFMLGFAKKALIADQLARVTDRGIFDQPPHLIPTGIAWLVIICYTLQIYFDFSAYSDMAIGLGQALGFNLAENFNYPYRSASITEFWRRWHISLSNWFRDYVFYPLEWKRKSVRWLNQPLNVLILFLLVGLWHGLTPPFIVWGLLQGAALVWERGRFGIWLRSLWRPLQNFYTLTIIVLGWVFFRSPSLAYAWNFLKALAGFSHPAAPLPFSAFPPVPALVWGALVAAVLLVFPVLPALEKTISRKLPAKPSAALAWAQNGLALAFFAIGLIVQAGASYQPFIYGGF